MKLLINSLKKSWDSLCFTCILWDNLRDDFAREWAEIHHRMHVKPLSRGFQVQCCPSLIGNSCCSQPKSLSFRIEELFFFLVCVFSVLQMPFVTKIHSSYDRVKYKKNKLTPRQLYMFRKIVFRHFLDVKLAVNWLYAIRFCWERLRRDRMT